MGNEVKQYGIFFTFTPIIHQIFFQLATTNKVESLEQLFKQFQPMLVGFAYKFVKSSEDARGIVQEVFISIWKNKDKLAFNQGLKSYLFTATKNKCLNFLEKKRLHIVSIDVNPSDDQPIIQIEDGNIDAADNMELFELQQVIMTEVAKLPPKCQQIFKMSRMEQLSYKEIAAKLDVSTKTVENQIGIALKRIRKAVFKYQNPNDITRSLFGFLLFSGFLLGDFNT